LVDGAITNDIKEMENHATEYFSNLYTADHSVQAAITTQLFQQKIDADTNESLCAPFTDEEISFALFQISPTKAPGPDGFPACFF
jgi:hypothetical protein